PNGSRSVSGLFAVSGPVLHGSRLTLSGTVQINQGGSFSGSSPTYSGSATLVYATGYTVGDEWVAGSAVGVGVPRNVTVQAGAGRSEEHTSELQSRVDLVC